MPNLTSANHDLKKINFKSIDLSSQPAKKLSGHVVIEQTPLPAILDTTFHAKINPRDSNSPKREASPQGSGSNPEIEKEIRIEENTKKILLGAIVAGTALILDGVGLNLIAPLAKVSSISIDVLLSAYFMRLSTLNQRAYQSVNDDSITPFSGVSSTFSRVFSTMNIFIGATKLLATAEALSSSNYGSAITMGVLSAMTLTHAWCWHRQAKAAEFLESD